MNASQIADALQGRRNGTGWMVRCPAHDDRNPSMSLVDGEGGKVLVKCFAGCTQDAVISALKGLGLWSNPLATGQRESAYKPNKRGGSENPPEPELGPPPQSTPAPDFGNASANWCYRDADGNALFYVARIDSADGKRFVPHSWDRRAQVWVNRGWVAPRPLYGLEGLAKRPNDLVLVVEGEKAADAARDLVGEKYVVMTWPNGAKAVAATDWRPLFGRRVLIWPDADQPGVEAAEAIGQILVKHGETKVISINLESGDDPFVQMLGFDAADAVRLGWNWESFVQWAKPRIRPVTASATSTDRETAGQGFESVGESVAAAEFERIKGRKAQCSTGIRYLDKAWTGGLGVGDVGLIAAPTGAGKTELTVHIATHNAASGRNVFLFALEAERYEITQRLLFRELASIYYVPLTHAQRCAKLGRPLNFSEWMSGRFDGMIADLEEQAAKQVSEKYKNLYVYYRERDFGIDELREQVLSVKDKADLICLDHLGYIDLDGPDENRSMSELVKAIRDIALIAQKPCLVISHIRKKDARAKALVPDLDDIHGTSNIAKICTKAVMLAPCFDETRKPNEFFSYLRVVKNRRDGSRCRFTAVVTFDISKNSYRDEFILGRLSKDGQEFEPLKADEMPFWIKD